MDAIAMPERNRASESGKCGGIVLCGCACVTASTNDIAFATMSPHHKMRTTLSLAAIGR